MCYLFHVSLNLYGLKGFQLKSSVRLGYEKGSNLLLSSMKWYYTFGKTNGCSKFTGEEVFTEISNITSMNNIEMSYIGSQVCQS
mgnify:FL=1